MEVLLTDLEGGGVGCNEDTTHELGDGQCGQWNNRSLLNGGLDQSVACAPNSPGDGAMQGGDARHGGFGDATGVPLPNLGHELVSSTPSALGKTEEAVN